MKGYFPRLIQQTGITFVPIDNTGHSTLEHPPVRLERRDAVNPIHSNEEKLIEPQADQTIRNTHEGVREDPEGLVQIPEEGHDQHSIEEVRVTKDEHTQHPLEERFENKVDQKPQQSGNLVDSVGQEHKKTKIVKSAIQSNNKINQAQSWQRYLKEVREWVAGTPVNEEKLEINRDRVKTGDTGKTVHTSIGEREMFTASYPRLIESQQREEPDIHDFHLSIGTISLTIEGPQKEVQSNQPPQVIRGERKSDRESVASRLSRHYIRIR